MTQEAAVPAGYLEQMRRMIREEVAAAQRSAPLRNASISEGGTLTIKGGTLRVQYPAAEGGGTGVYFGDLYLSETSEYLGTGLLVQGPNGEDIAQFRSDAATGTVRAVIDDVAGNSAVSTDAVGGFGLGRPYLSNGFVPARSSDWAASTTSSTFETLFTSVGYRTHAGIMAWTWSAMDTGGTTGEVRVLVNGTELEAPNAVGFSHTLNYHGPTKVPGDAYAVVTVEIQGRVTGGAGALRVGGGGWISRSV